MGAYTNCRAVGSKSVEKISCDLDFISKPSALQSIGRNSDTYEDSKPEIKVTFTYQDHSVPLLLYSRELTRILST